MEMKWLVVVLFATIQGDIFIFHTPSFDSREECMTAVKERRVDLLTRLYVEYGKPMPIQAVNCLDTDTLNKIFEDAEMKPIESHYIP